ncbi:hypothetical protein B9Z19DRAFT_776624 [Tuber borchii]|uniref:Uncharacterized protein n=1 Tax=Tuber borchii TaxID=42251 RepID=A0A2T6ZWQ3_TUBBO|nr:hypothetical protein B9Z19DRAFT_776624 [Tuber borchii]
MLPFGNTMISTTNGPPLYFRLALQTEPRKKEKGKTITREHEHKKQTIDDKTKIKQAKQKNLRKQRPKKKGKETKPKGCKHFVCPQIRYTPPTPNQVSIYLNRASKFKYLFSNQSPSRGSVFTPPINYCRDQVRNHRGDAQTALLTVCWPRYQLLEEYITGTYASS